MRHIRVRGPNGVENGSVADRRITLEGGTAIEPLDHETLQLPEPYELLAPIEAPEIWCAGVTYERSRDARVEESKVKDVYTMVYDAPRPELFMKDAMMRRTVGPGAPIGIREDSPWNVPEPEIGVVLGKNGRIAGYTIGNDVSSRSIEDENPLYLPQAKIYAGACSFGPSVFVSGDHDRPFQLTLRVTDEWGQIVFEGETSTARMKRSFDELVRWLTVDNPVPQGSILLTGTGLVPPFAKAAAAIESRAEQVAQDMTAEMGKPLREARLETLRAATILRYAAGEAYRPIGEMFEPSVPDQRLFTMRRPLGVVGLITPWNFPIAIPVWKLAPALIYGNTLVLKLGYEAPRTGLHVAECFAEAGLPAGVLNVLTGAGSKVGAEIVSNPGVRAISFTGSVPVGRSVRDEATARDCRVQLELGGHNPLIVTASAELERAVEASYAGAFWSAGQKCTATRRILVEDSAYDAFREKLLARVAAGKVGDPADPDVEVGPVVNEGAMDEILGAVERARSEGGTVLAGGERADDDGFLIAPTVVEGLADDAELSCEEVFGPVTSLYRYSSFDEAIERANAVRFGLSASIFTRDLRETQRFTSEIQAGIIHVNSQTAGADVHVPFGGVKGSGWGPHEQGRAAIEFYTETVTVYQDAPLA